MARTRIISTSDQINSTMDSMYNAFGSFEIYVSEEDKEKAIELLEKNEDTSHS